MKKELIGIALMSILMFACNNSTKVEDDSTQEIVQEIIDESGTDNLTIETAHLLLTPPLFKLKLTNDPTVTLLDIRTPEELEENGTIDGAKNVDFYADDFKDQIDAMDREEPVMLFCRSGGRSGEAASMLKEMGFKKVFDLNGGYNAWLEEGY